MKNKSLILIMLFSVITFISNAQSSSQKQIEPTKSLTVEEVNRTSGIPNPTINGKPYSQYKAEQDALKKEREAKLIAAKTNNADAATITVTNTASKTNVAPATKETNKVSDDENPVVPAKQKVQQPVTKQEVKPAEVKQPQVPDQFKLPASQKWDGKTVADKQNQNTTTTQQPKLPEVVLVKESPAAKTVTTNAVAQPDNKVPGSTDTPQQAKKEN
jgi:hypothetical protein